MGEDLQQRSSARSLDLAWGGDWAYTDPMHFEMETLVSPGGVSARK